jgi:N-acetylglutamate synthase
MTAHITALELLGINALPALDTLLDDGWILRFARGYTRRANAVHPLYPAQRPLAEKIALCERYYTTRDLPTTFKLTAASLPTDLDATLDSLGYQHALGASVQTTPLDSTPLPTSPSRMVSQYSARWGASYARLNAIPEQHWPTLFQLLQRIPLPICQATVLHGDEVAAVGLGVLERDHLGIYDIVTDSHLRGQGYGRQVMLHLMRWGWEQGARQAYLQVVPTNTAAVTLYASLGFTETYAYWYRSKAPAQHP